MIYQLKPIKPWEPWYDKNFCVVVRAKSVAEARGAAAAECGAEGKSAWLDSSLTTCERVDPRGGHEVLCVDSRMA